MFNKNSICKAFLQSLDEKHSESANIIIDTKIKIIVHNNVS